MHDTNGLDLRKDARKIFLAALHAVEPAPLVHAALLNTPELYNNSRIHVIAAGKAAAGMAAAALETLGERVASCIVAAPANTLGHAGSTLSAPHVRVFAAGHPFPDASSATAAAAVMDAIGSAGDQDVIVVLLSGGASALLALPADGISMDDYRSLTRLLQEAGASIADLNGVRRHIDLIKAGGLARAAAPRAVIGLVISDVIGNRLDVIASGPLTADTSTPEDALEVIERLGLSQRIPATVMHHLEKSAPRSIVSDDASFDHVRVQILADIQDALDDAVAYARRLGYNTALITEPTIGDARAAGSALGGHLRESKPQQHPTCFIAGGETTVSVTGAGKGGRNQELALAAAIAIDGDPDCVLLSAGTDGIDGPTDAAGGIVDGATCTRITAAGLDARAMLERNDSYAALAAAGDLLITGPTGTNVMDIQILLHR